MNKLIIVTTLFFTSLAFALPEDAKQPIEIEAKSVTVDETNGFNEFSGNAEPSMTRRSSLISKWGRRGVMNNALISFQSTLLFGPESKVRRHPRLASD